MKRLAALLGLLACGWASAQSGNPGGPAYVPGPPFVITLPLTGQCLTYNGTVWVNSTCGTSTGAPFSGITGSTNTTAAMVVGTGASLATSGSGTIAATSLTALTGLPAQSPGTIVGVPGPVGGAAATPQAVYVGSLLANFDVTAYGVLCNNSADDTTGINNAFAAARTAYGAGNNIAVKVTFPAQTRCKISGPINVTGFTNTANSLIVDFQGAYLISSQSSTPLIDALGSIRVIWNDVHAIVGSGTPTYGIQIGRTAGTSTNGGGAGMVFNNLNISGAFTIAACYSFSGEEVIWNNALCANTTTAGAAFGLILDGANHFNITSTFVTETAPVDTYQSMNENTFTGGSFKAASASGAPIWMQNVASARFRNSYGFNSAVNSSCVYLYATSASVSYGPNRSVDFDLHCEAANLKQTFFITGPGTGGANFTATPLMKSISYRDVFAYAGTSVMAIDAAANITGVTINNLNVEIDSSNTVPPFFDTAANYTCDGAGYFYNASIWNGTSSCPMLLDNAGTTTLSLSTPLASASGGLGVATVPTAGQVAVGNAGGTAYAPKSLSGDCTLASTGAITCLNTNGTAFGTFATQNYATPPAIGGTTPAAGSFTTGTFAPTGNYTDAQILAGIFHTPTATLTDTTGSGTEAGNFGISLFGTATMTASSATTYSGIIATIECTGAPVASTNVTFSLTAYCIDSQGPVRFASTLNVNGVAALLGGLSASGASVNLNSSSNFNTTINGGTSTGTITIGNSGTTGVTVLAGVASGTASTAVCLSSGGVVINCPGGPILSGTTGSIGGSALLAGQCSTGTVSITGATTGMAVVATPVTYPTTGNFWQAYVSSANTVTVAVCAAVADTPTASTYNVRVLQ